MDAAPRHAGPAPAADQGLRALPSGPAGSERRTVFAATEQAMERARALQGTLRRVADAYPTAEERAVHLVDAALHDLDAAVAIAWRMVADETALDLAGATPRASEFFATGDHISLAAESPMSEAVRTGRVLFFGSRASIVERYPQFGATADRLQLAALAAVPARHMGRMHGVLVVGWQSPRELAATEQVMLRTAAGRLARALAHARLYYAERAAHASAEEARREAERARADAEQSRRLAEDANRAKDDFLAVVSHELRTPLQAILGFSDLLDAGIAGPLAPRQHDYVRRVQAAGNHLLDTVENLLGFARAQAGKEVVIAERFDAGATVAQVLDIAAPLAARRGLTLTHAGVTTGVTAVSDERKLRQIVTNLVGNAIKFTESGGVTAEAAIVADATGADRLRVSVRDTGIGIPAEQLASVFEPFVQVSGGPGGSPTTRPSSGTGLGLSIARQLATLLGGELTATSVVGQGSTFVVDIPRTYGVPDAPAL